MSSFDIKKLVIITTTLVTLIMMATFIVTILSVDNQNSQTQQVMTEQHKKCDHEFVMTSKWDSFHQQYKTISKCIKCGLEIE